METLKIDRDGGIVELTMDRPRVRNSVNGLMQRELLRAFAEIANRPDDRVVVLGGAGAAFCAGADLSDDTTDPITLLRGLNALVLQMHRMPKPVIAKVGGPAVGGGCSLALACDLVIASPSASFSEIFVQKGLSLDVGSSWLLPRIVGFHRARELAFFGDFLDGASAERLGLVNKVVPSEALDMETRTWASRLVAGSAGALGTIKSLLSASYSSTLEGALAMEVDCAIERLASADAKEAMLAFREKRPPRFPSSAAS